MTITAAGSSGYRGETLHVEGRIDGPTRPLASRRVDVYLAPQGHGGEGAILVGHGVTNARGMFAADVDLPAALDIATYELYLGTPDDDRYNAAFSQ